MSFAPGSSRWGSSSNLGSAERLLLEGGCPLRSTVRHLAARRADHGDVGGDRRDQHGRARAHGRIRHDASSRQQEMGRYSAGRDGSRADGISRRGHRDYTRRRFGLGTLNNWDTDAAATELQPRLHGPYSPGPLGSEWGLLDRGYRDGSRLSACCASRVAAANRRSVASIGVTSVPHIAACRRPDKPVVCREEPTDVKCRARKATSDAHGAARIRPVVIAQQFP